jgi:hypothetical protein
MFPFPPKGESAAARSSSSSFLCAVLGEEPFKVASHEHRPQLVLVGNVELIAPMIIPARFSGVCPPTSRCAG